MYFHVLNFCWSNTKRFLSVLVVFGKYFVFAKIVKFFKNNVALFWWLSCRLVQSHAPVASPHRDFSRLIGGSMSILCAFFPCFLVLCVCLVLYLFLCVFVCWLCVFLLLYVHVWSEGITSKNASKKGKMQLQEDASPKSAMFNRLGGLTS